MTQPDALAEIRANCQKILAAEALVGNAFGVECFALARFALKVLERYDGSLYLEYLLQQCASELLTALVSALTERYQKAEARVLWLEERLAVSHKAVAQWEQNFGVVAVKLEKAEARVKELEKMDDEMTDSMDRTLEYARQIKGSRDVHSVEEVLDLLKRQRDQALKELQAEKARLDWLEDPASKVRGVAVVSGDPGWLEITVQYIKEPTIRQHRGKNWREAIDSARGEDAGL